jgi:probable HAF family extracellular repeat protein/cysteine-rich repeat protein
MMDLGTLGGDFSDARGINSHGDVVGAARTAALKEHAFLYAAGAMTDLLPSSSQSRAYGINTAGQVAGTRDGGSSSFLYTGGTFTDLGNLGGSATIAFALNDAASVVGWSGTSTPSQHAFLYSGGMITDLAPSSASSHAFAINSSGQAVGDDGPLAAVFGGGMPMDLTTLGGSDGRALGINDSGAIVGWSTTSSNDVHAFIVEGVGMPADLNDRLVPGTGWVLASATGINNVGQIVGCGLIDGTTHAFRLEPCGDGIVEPGEQCDDGPSNGATGSCCSSTCQALPAGSGCADDGDLCTNDVCGQTGICGHLVEPSASCTAPVQAKGANLAITEPPSPKPQQVVFRWGKGPAVPLANFGTPTSEDVRLCVYDQTGSTYTLAFGGSASVAGGGAWIARSTGWKFKSRSGAPDGITDTTLTASNAPLKAKLQAKAKGHLSIEALPLQKSPRAVAQLKTSQGECWGASFSSATKNSTTAFRARSD